MDKYLLIYCATQTMHSQRMQIVSYATVIHNFPKKISDILNHKVLNKFLIPKS